MDAQMINRQLEDLLGKAKLATPAKRAELFRKIRKLRADRDLALMAAR